MLTSTVFAVQEEVEKIEAGFQIKPDIGLNTDCNCNNVDIPSPPIYQECNWCKILLSLMKI